MKTLATLIVAAGLTAGCVNYPSPVDEQFGSAVTRARAQQVIDPDAPSRPRPPMTQDGQAAKATIDRYEKSYETPPPPVNVFTIGVGGGTGSTGSSR